MCGIVGCIGQIGTKELNAFKIMLQLDVLRGKDSTGIFGVTTTGEVMSAKEAWLPQDFLESALVKNILKSNLKVLVGHNRYATVGNVNKANAHPFEFDKVIGVHNGTTPKYRFSGHDKFTVDSEAMYWHINNRGLNDAWKNLSGAASLAFYDKVDKTFNLARNKERPMEFSLTKDGKTLFFASESWMIHVACLKCGIDTQEYFQTDVDKVYSYNPFAQNIEPVVKDLDVYQEVKSYLSPSVWNNWGDLGRNTTASCYEDLTVGEEVVFEFVRTERTGNTLTAYVRTVETPTKLLGRVYLDPNDEAKNQNFMNSVNMFKGRISSVVSLKAYEGFTVQLKSIEEIEENDYSDSLDPVEGIVFEGDVSRTYTKADFDRKIGIDNCCSWCLSPVDFELLDFKGAGKSNGVQQVVCLDCLNTFREDIEGFVDIQEVWDVSGL